MKHRLMIIGSLLSVALVASVAWAYWTTDGGGSGTATVDANFPEELEVTSTVVNTEGDGLHPGDDLDLTVTVENPVENEGTASFYSVTGAVDAPVGCEDLDFSIDEVTTFTDHTLAAGASSTGTAVIEFADDEDTSQDSCKSDELDITWTVVPVGP